MKEPVFLSVVCDSQAGFFFAGEGFVQVADNSSGWFSLSGRFVAVLLGRFGGDRS